MEPKRVFHSPQGPGGTAGEEGFASPASFPDLDVFNREEIAFSPSTVDAAFDFDASKERISSPVGVVHELPSSPGAWVEESSSGSFQPQSLPAAALGPVGGGTAEWRLNLSSSFPEPVLPFVPVVPTVPEGDKQLLLSAAPSEGTSFHESAGPMAASDSPSTGFVGYGLTAMEPKSSISPHVMNVEEEQGQESNSANRSAEAIEATHQLEIPQQLDAEDLEASRPPAIPQTLNAGSVEESGPPAIPQQFAAGSIERSRPLEVSQQLAEVPSSCAMDDRSSPADPIIALVSPVVSKSAEAKEQLPNSADPSPNAMELSPGHELSRSSEAKEQVLNSTEPCADAMELSPTEEFSRSSEANEQLPNSAEPCADAMGFSPTKECSRSCEAKQQLPNSAEPCPDVMELSPTHGFSRSSEAKEQLPNSAEACPEDMELPPTHEISRSSEAKKRLPNSAEACPEDMELPPTHEISRSSEAKEQLPNSAEPCPEAMELPPTYDISRPPPETTEVATANGSESGLERCDQHEDEERPAKRAKNGIVYTGASAVSAVLGQTAEIVLVLAGMAQMRAGRTPTSYERELATTAYQNLGILVSRVTPNSLVARESVEKMIRDFDMKKAAQKRRQDQAWHDAVTEAEALANARVEAIARAKAEAAARAQAEAKEVERVRQAAMTAAALAANDPGRCGFSPAAVPPLSSGQSESFASGVVQSPVLSTPATHPSPQAETVSQSPVSKAADVARSSPPEKCVSINGLSHLPASRPGLAKPPKIRNRARKDPAAVAFYAPDLLTQDQSQDPQKPQFTHKQLCFGVQRFIRDHVPQAPQTLQALPPSYISKPEPCQICKLIAPDTESVLVCDTCDEVSHVKCVHPNPSKWDSERDWNCSKCIMANRGYDCPSKYGPIRRGAPNSVTLWPPHETSEDHREPTCGPPNGSVKGRLESIRDGRRVNAGLKVQRKTSLEINTDSRPSHDDHNTGSLGNSPHLVVHLVNEPSPRPSALLDKPSHLLRGDSRRPLPSAQTSLSSMQDLPSSKIVAVGGAAESQTAPMGEIAQMLSNPSDSLRMPVTEIAEKGLGKSDSRYGSLAECAKQEARKNQVQIEKPETKIKIVGSKKGGADSSASLAEKQAAVPNPVGMEWVGGSIRQAEGKVYYRACRVGGITFSVSDCALFTPEPPDVAPYIARLQVLWEDIATSHKWVRVSWCYYPSDIPLSMDRPGSTNPNEVYESNHCDDNLIGSIKGPCFVLPQTKFREEVERRSTLKMGREAVDELPPLFLSRWMYDASKVVFRPLQE